MTNREFLHAVINYACDGEDEINGVNANELISVAQAMIEKMDARNEKRASTPSKTAIANEPIKASIMGLLTTEPKTAAEIGATLEIGPHKASALLRQLVEKGTVISTDVKVKGKGKVKGYYITVTE